MSAADLPTLEDYRSRYTPVAEPVPAQVQADMDHVEAGRDNIWFDRHTEPRDPNPAVADLQDQRDQLFARGQVEYAEQAQVELDSLWSPSLFDREPEVEAG